ncbi:MAG: prephenate dehydratase [Nitrososphaerota archaeon]|nr:prephenate dehydratase [Nitrososphaerota archaeon]
MLRPTAGRARVAFQGELGAYSQGAVYAFFGKVDVVPLPTLQRVFASLSEPPGGQVDFAVVPIENSVAGSVGETFDLLFSSDVRIVGETSIPVRHCLMIHRDAGPEGITKVMSHPQGLAQCREYLDAHHRGWEQVPAYDTAGSAKMIRDRAMKDTAAIASELACEIYGMTLLARGVEDDHSNATRFVVIARADAPGETAPTGDDKTSVIFTTSHAAGSLVRALGCLSSRGISLARVESRPIRGRSWEYSFYVDFYGHMKDKKCAEGLEELGRDTLQLKVLGSYPRAV